MLSFQRGPGSIQWVGTMPLNLLCKRSEGPCLGSHPSLAKSRWLQELVHPRAGCVAKLQGWQRFLGHPRALLPWHTGPPPTGGATVIKDEDGELGVGIRDSVRAGISGKSLLQAAFLEGAGDDLGLSFCLWDIRSKQKASVEQQRMKNVSLAA